MHPAAITHSRVDFVQSRLSIASRLLSAPPECDVDIVQRVSLAAQNILEAVYGCGGADVAAIAPDASRQTAALLLNVAPTVVQAAGDKVLPERIYFLLGAASGLLTNRDDPFMMDRIDYAGMLQAELSQIHHARAISERGFPMLRAARINMAAAQPRSAETQLD